MQGPFLVGTLSDAAALCEYADTQSAPLTPDLVEIRLDLIDPSEYPGCFAACRTLEGKGAQVLTTIRLEDQGGQWKVGDEARRALFSEALKSTSWVDVEVSSKIAAVVIAEAHAAGKKAVVSYHNFQTTPPLSELKDIVKACAAHGADVAKIATMVTRPEHSDALGDLLRETSGQVQLCVIGMGSAGLPSRISLPTKGSVFAYAYLDTPSAPGQLSCSKMLEFLRLQIPSFNERFLDRTKSLDGA